MVFQKRAKKCSEQTFYIGNQAIDVVQDYTYLGTKISSSGNFKISFDHLKEKALHTLFSLRRYTNFSKLKPSLACKIFDTMISPILLYNVKFGVVMLNLILRPGMVHKLKEHIYSFVNVILKLVIRLLMLHVELNLIDLLYLLPLIKESSTTCYISKTSKPDSFVRQSFLISSELHTAGKNSF